MPLIQDTKKGTDASHSPIKPLIPRTMFSPHGLSLVLTPRIICFTVCGIKRRNSVLIGSMTFSTSLIVIETVLKSV